jgi:hypothetical protein
METGDGFESHNTCDDIFLENVLSGEKPNAECFTNLNKVVRDGRTLCNLMTRYSDGMLTDDTLNAIIAFLRSVEPVRQQIPRSTCP